jgi:hypothetical protein
MTEDKLKQIRNDMEKHWKEAVRRPSSETARQHITEMLRACQLLVLEVEELNGVIAYMERYGC